MPALDRNGWIRLGAMLAVTAIALGLRTPQLERRPFHNDEANQAGKLGDLLETGVYRYDPHDHHGPTLYYLALPLARLQSGGSFAATEIWLYRALPVAFGVLLVLLVLGARAALGRGGALAAALLTAVSPAMVYFSRFYIQEMLLVTFTFALLLCLWRCLRTASFAWAAAAGASAGLMHATKETCVLAWAALAAAAIVHRLRRRQSKAVKFPAAPAVADGQVGRGGQYRTPIERFAPDRQSPRPGQQNGKLNGVGRQPRGVAALGWRHLAVAGGVAGVISVLFFSSFLTHWRGVLDALRAYTVFLGRGAAIDTPHRQPFFFYFDILTASRSAPGLTWGEDMILGLGLVGALVAWAWPRRLQADPEAVRLLSVYTVVLTLIYAAIPYKTPWCLLSFWHGWILLAGVGAVVLIMLPRRRWQRVLLALLLAAGSVQLAQRAWWAAIRYPAEARNPYVYAQTGMDFLRLVDRVNALSSIAPEAKDLRIHVIAPPDQTWPLPWYLRRFTRVGYWTEPVPAALAADPAVIIATPEADLGLPAELQRRYVSEYYGLRPEVLLAVHIRADFWERFLISRAAPSARGNPPKEP
jgi:uncharacterized protein (TIGR03663 family)